MCMWSGVLSIKQELCTAAGLCTEPWFGRALSSSNVHGMPLKALNLAERVKHVQGGEEPSGNLERQLAFRIGQARKA